MSGKTEIAPAAPVDDLAFKVELHAACGTELLAECATPGVAYAAYYEAFREHLGVRVQLSKDGMVLARSR